MEEQLARSTVRLSDALEWTAPREAVFEVVLLAMPDDQLDSVSSVLSSPADVLGFHEVMRMPYGPDLLHQIVQDGRLGKHDGLGFLGQAPEEVHLTTSEVPIPIFPVPKARAKEMPIVARRGRGTGIRGRAPRSQAKPSEPELKNPKRNDGECSATVDPPRPLLAARVLDCRQFWEVIQ